MHVHLQIPHRPSLFLSSSIFFFLSSGCYFLVNIWDLGGRCGVRVFLGALVLFVFIGLDMGEIGMGLNLKLFVARSARRMAVVAKEASAVGACIRCLEEERHKIEVFRRKPSLCVRLLADVVEVMMEDAEKSREDGDAEAKA